MSSFLYSSAAKVAPESLLSPSHLLITQSNRKAMESPTSPNLPITPLDNLSDELIKPINLSSDELIKLVNLSSDQKVRLNPGLISPRPPYAGGFSAGHPSEENHEKLQPTISGSAYRANASPEGSSLWPKHTELDDLPFSPSDKPIISDPASLPKRPSSWGSEKTQVIRDPTYLFPEKKELDGSPLSPSGFKSEKVEARREPTYRSDSVPNRPSSPSSFKSEKMQVIREPAYQAELGMNRPSSPSTSFKSEKMQVIREPAYQAELVMNRPSSPSSFKSEKMQVIREPAYQAELGMNRPSSPPYLNAMKPRTQANREVDYQLPSQASGEEAKTQTGSEGAYDKSWHDNKLMGIKESYRTSARGKLASVVEESESFSRREFGANELLYMSTHSSANHAANFSTHSSYNHYNFSSKLPSYHHNSSHNFTFPGAHLQTAKSAPAGTALRTRSGFNWLRRGSSESAAKLGQRAAYQRPRSKKPQSLGDTLMWPLVKIKNGYVGCMMGLEESGDLSGMAQGGTYATRARYFADVPISKIDLTNHG